MSEGQRRLVAVRRSLAAIAKELGVSKQMVSQWRRGSKRPGTANRAKLADVFGIPADSWDLDLRRQSDEVDSGRGPRPRPGTTFEQTLATLEMVDDVLSRQGLAPSLIEKFLQRRTSALSLKHKIEQDQILLEDRIVNEHPKWIRIREALARFVERLPRDLARELADELAALGGDV